MATLAQQKAIDSRVRQVIVTASAGAGKTSTMVNRVIDLIVKDRVPITSIVMLTFTEAAAEEMKTRLAAALIDAIKSSSGEIRATLVDALDALPVFHCSTIDAFCYKIVRSHFELLGLSPLHALVAEDLAASYKEKALRELFAEMAEQDAEAYFDLLASFGKNEEDALKRTITEVYAFAETTEDGDAFLLRAEETLKKKPDDLPYIRELIDGIVRRAEETRREILSRALEIPVGAKNIGRRYQKILDSLDSYAHCKTLFDVARAKSDFSLKGNLGKDPVDYPVANEEYARIEKLYRDFRDGCLPDRVSLGADASETLLEIGASEAETLRLIAVVREFKKRYHRIKEEERALDFADVEHGALTLFEKYGVAEELACDYLLVDECQDLNPLQDALMRLIVREGNLFTVGDVKQSIYRFRLSDPEIFQERVRRGESAADAEVIRFEENFRSSDAVIDFVNRIFTRLMDRDFGGEIYYPATRGDRHFGSGAVRCCFYPKEEEPTEIGGVYSVRSAAARVEETERTCFEGEWICARIAELVGKRARRTKDDSEYTISYGDIAILSAKKMRPGTVQEGIVNCLRRAGIPLNLGDFAEEDDCPEILSIVDFLRLIESPRNDFALLSVLRSDMFGFSLDRLAEISLAEGETFFEKAEGAAERGDPDLRAFYAYLDGMRFLSASLPLHELVSRLIDERLRLPVLNRPDGRKVFGELLAFADSLKQGKSCASVAEFLPYYDTYYRREGGGEVEERNAVSVMTIHASKGMQFPVVFVVGLGDGIVMSNDKSKVHIDKEYGIFKKPLSTGQKHLVSELFRIKKNRELTEDKLRLLYVAMTRAENFLFLSGEMREGDALVPKETAKRVYQWILGVVGEQREFGEFDLQEGAASVTSCPSIGVPSSDPSMLMQAFAYRYPHKKATATGIKYTATSINAMEEEGYAPPTMLFPEEKTAKGTAYHAVMEEIPFTLASAEETRTFLDKLLADGRLSEKERSDLSPVKVFETLQGVRALTGDRRILREKSFLLHLSAREAGVAEIEDQVEVQGKIDLLAIGEKDAVLIDYKLSALSAPLLAEKYRAQLELYALAVKKGYGIDRIDKYIYVLGRNETIKL